MEIIADDKAIKIVHIEQEVDKNNFELLNESFALEGLESPRATLFLNGWWTGNHRAYADDIKDVEIKGIKINISNVRSEDGQLKWETRGNLSWDKGVLGGILDFLSSTPPTRNPKWRYYYTVIAWSAGFTDLVTDQVTIENGANGGLKSKFSNPRPYFPVVGYSSLHHNEMYEKKETLAVLPQGFGMQMSDDHHLFQIGYALGCSEQFAVKGKNYAEIRPPDFGGTSMRYRAGHISWHNETILRDKRYRNHHSRAWNITIAGDDLGWIDPPFTLFPHNTQSRPGGIIGDAERVHRQQFTVDNLPFAYAVPVLAGWDLKYNYSDERVHEMGVWLSDISYSRKIGQLTGKLSYTLNSIFRDDDDIPSFKTRHKVNILGINPKGVLGDGVLDPIDDI